MDGDVVTEGREFAASSAAARGASRRRTGRDACPSITHPHSSHTPFPNRDPKSVFAIDWLEGSACVTWDQSLRSAARQGLDSVQGEAHARSQPVPFDAVGIGGVMYPRGMGVGHEARIEYRLEFKGITIGLALRPEATRQLPNLYYKIPGEACLLVGAVEGRQWVRDFVGSLGGTVHDEWPRRLDLCLDLPGFSFKRNLLSSLRKKHYLTVAHKHQLFSDNHAFTGFKAGKAGSIAVTIYDKLTESQLKSEAYQAALILNRWHGRRPRAATRVEFQLGRAFLSQLEARTTEEILKCLPALVAKLTDEKHPRLRLVTTKPDRGNNHQSRLQTLRAWAMIMGQFRSHVGQPLAPLKKINRSALLPKKAFRSAVGYILSASANLNRNVETVRDLKEVFSDLVDLMEINDTEIRQKYDTKARKFGTLDSLTDFDVSRF